MYIFGIGLHVVLALICAVHVVRTGQHNYWLFILFAFPGLGSLVYLLTVQKLNCLKVHYVKLANTMLISNYITM